MLTSFGVPRYLLDACAAGIRESGGRFRDKDMRKIESLKRYGSNLKDRDTLLGPGVVERRVLGRLGMQAAE